MDFDWDPQKAATNLQKHGVSFTEAATVFDDPLSLSGQDPDHSTAEDRLIIVRLSHQRRLLIVSFAEREDRFGIVSARELTRVEGRAYEKVLAG